jgi:hypothetical protein
MLAVRPLAQTVGRLILVPRDQALRLFACVGRWAKARLPLSAITKLDSGSPTLAVAASAIADMGARGETTTASGTLRDAHLGRYEARQGMR